MTTVAKFKAEDLKPLEAKSKNQQVAIDAYGRNSNLVLSGAAGSGKTYLALRLAIESVLVGDFKKAIIVRSVVPTRQIGFLPGTEEEKSEVYKAPYKNLLGEIFKSRAAWDRLESNGHVQFEITSFLRGLTWDNAIVIVDECQNMTFHELDTIITRLGDNSSIIFSGDFYQTDLKGRGEQSGLQDFMKVLECIDSFEMVNFTWKDIVRSDLVRRYIIAKETLMKENKIAV